jgi:hypothetical protein
VIKGGTPSLTFVFPLENTAQDGPEHFKINNMRYPLKRITHTAQAPQPIAFIEKSKLMFHMAYIHHKYNYCKLFFLAIKKYYMKSHGRQLEFLEVPFNHNEHDENQDIESLWVYSSPLAARQQHTLTYS